MPVIILDETTPSPFLTNFGDEYLIPVGATFTGELINTIDEGTPSQVNVTDLSLKIDGTFIASKEFGLDWESDEDTNVGNHSIIIGQTGTVEGHVFVNGTGSSVINYGTIGVEGQNGSSFGFVGPGGTARNYGTIYGNFGTFTDGGEIINRGTIEGAVAGLRASGYDLTVKNSGNINGDLYTSDGGSASVIILSATSFIFRNSGTITSDEGYGVHTTGASGEIINYGSGFIDNLYVAEFVSSQNENTNIINRGEITHIEAHGVGNILRNSGTMQSVEFIGDETIIKNFGEIESIVIEGDKNVVRNFEQIDSIHLDGQNNRIVNKGTISIDLAESDMTEAVLLGGTNTLVNFGEIHANALGFETPQNVAAVWNFGGKIFNYGDIRLDTPADVINFHLYGTATIKLHGAKLVNTGTISGTSGIHYDSHTIIKNTGTISTDGIAISLGFTGPIGLDNSLTIYNSGTIENTNAGHGVIYMDDGDDLLINTGTITGSVSFSAGDDVYKGKTGTVDGLIDAGSGADKLYSGTGDETFDGGIGADRFIFKGDSGADVILNFEQGADKVRLSQYEIDGFADVLAAATDTVDGVLIALDELGGSGSILFDGIEIADLTQHDFIL